MQQESERYITPVSSGEGFSKKDTALPRHRLGTYRFKYV